jgi:TRAP-type C4-dicarboxylate transport system permease small subunit
MQENSLLSKTEHLSRRILKIEHILAAGAMAVLCILTFANVLVRYFSNISFAFTEEFSIFLLVFLTLVGASSAFAKNKQIEITLLVERLPSLAQRIMRGMVWAANLLMFGLLLWFGTWFAFDDFRFEVTSSSLGYPQWWYSIWLPLLSLGILLRLLLAAMQAYLQRHRT